MEFMVSEKSYLNTIILGLFVLVSFVVVGLLVSNTAIKIKEYERTVTAKGLSEQEYDADIVIWPIVFSQASNNLTELYNSTETSTGKIKRFLIDNGIAADEISFSSPKITDKSIHQYGGSSRAEFRYTSSQTVTVYSRHVAVVRSLMGGLSELGKKGIVFTGDDYQTKPEYIFTRLNEVKPGMIAEATKKAREVAQKFATDSNSQLGKLKEQHRDSSVSMCEIKIILI
jgi:uncharacterized protein